MVFFKIIIPSYNDARWLRKCLDSIKNQTFKDYEVVVVDDMSTDNSVEIIKEYPFHLIVNNQKRYNGGTRNVGILYPIESKYTLFIDSDDWFYDENVFQTSGPGSVPGLMRAAVPTASLLSKDAVSSLQLAVGNFCPSCWAK